MGNVIHLCDHRDDGWREVFSYDGPSSTLQVYANAKTGEVEIVQMNDDNESIRTVVSGYDVDHLVLAVTNAFDKKGASR